MCHQPAALGGMPMVSRSSRQRLLSVDKRPMSPAGINVVFGDHVYRQALTQEELERAASDFFLSGASDTESLKDFLSSLRPARHRRRVPGPSQGDDDGE